MLSRTYKKLLSILQPETITFRLTLKYAIIISITLLLVSATTLISVRTYVYNQSSYQITSIGNMLQDKISSSKSITNAELDEISKISNNIDVNIKTGENIIYKSSESYEFIIPYEISGKTKKYDKDNSNLLYYNLSNKNNSNEIITIQVIKDMYDDGEFIEVLFWILLVINGIGVVVSIALGYLMSKKALKPIDDMVMQAKSISVSDLSGRISIEGPDDELNRLAVTFNDLISRIEIGYERQNRFALDASHELATPLAVIKGYLDIVGKWGKFQPEVLDEAINKMKIEVKSMTELLDKLLFVAKGDNDIAKFDKSEFWVNELIVEVYKEAKLIYPDFDMRIDDNQSLKLYGDRKLIKQMLRAIIDNSVKYSGKIKAISISCNRVDDYARLTVSDKGIGISDDDIKYVFERFYRVDKSRSREIGGVGLGLSIVKWIVDIHEGKINIKSKINDGTKMIIDIPLSNE